MGLLLQNIIVSIGIQESLLLFWFGFVAVALRWLRGHNNKVDLATWALIWSPLVLSILGVSIRARQFHCMYALLDNAGALNATQSLLMVVSDVQNWIRSLFFGVFLVTVLFWIHRSNAPVRSN